MDNQVGRIRHVCSCQNCQDSPQGKDAEEHAAINRVLATLDERGRRLLVGLLAQQHGRGGLELLFQITGLSRNTIRRGLREIQAGVPGTTQRIRQAGAGRPRVEKKHLL
jgi:hypothetical protein